MASYRSLVRWQASKCQTWPPLRPSSSSPAAKKGAAHSLRIAARLWALRTRRSWTWYESAVCLDPVSLPLWQTICSLRKIQVVRMASRQCACKQVRKDWGLKGTVGNPGWQDTMRQYLKHDRQQAAASVAELSRRTADCGQGAEESGTLRAYHYEIHSTDSLQTSACMHARACSIMVLDIRCADTTRRDYTDTTHRLSQHEPRG